MTKPRTVGSQKPAPRPLESHQGYQLLEPWRTKGAGSCVWSFATKEGKDYFIKQFVSPVLPDASSGMSPAIIEKKRKICDRFFEAKNKVYTAVNDSATGNIIKIEAFFRDGSKFYLVTERVFGAESNPAEISALPHGQKSLFIKLLAKSILSLHEHGVIHGDLKSGNVLVKKSATGMPLAKLIDFGESYLIENPTPSLVTGPYMSPEACRAAFGEDVVITDKTDVFGLGLMFHEYYTGTMPHFPKDYNYACQALLNKQKLKLNKAKLSGWPELLAAIDGMLRKNPAKRLSMEQVYAILDGKQAPNTWTCRCGRIVQKGMTCGCGNMETALHTWTCNTCGKELPMGTVCPNCNWTCQCGMSVPKGVTCPNCKREENEPDPGPSDGESRIKKRIHLKSDGMPSSPTPPPKIDTLFQTADSMALTGEKEL